MTTQHEQGKVRRHFETTTRLWRLVGRVILGAALLTLPGSTRLVAQVSPLSEQPFSQYQRDVDTIADSMLAEAHGRPVSLLIDGVPTVPAVPAAPSARRQDVVREFAQRYWNGRYEDLWRAIGRVQSLRLSIEPILRSQGLPPDLIAVVLVESAGEPLARSPRGTRGLWQLMPATARRYGLMVSAHVDERIDETKATRAAARYLKDLYARFESWPLAFAAYNAGEATVQRAIGSGSAHDFANVESRRELPTETRNYVPAIFAARKLFEQPRGSADPHLGDVPPNLAPRIVYAGGSSQEFVASTADLSGATSHASITSLRGILAERLQHPDTPPKHVD
jgi:hypothetical protein